MEFNFDSETSQPQNPPPSGSLMRKQNCGSLMSVQRFVNGN